MSFRHLEVIPLSGLVESYLSQSAAYDMSAKVASNTLKLILLYTDDAPMTYVTLRSRAARLVDKILYFRMLLNQVRYPGTIKGLFKALVKDGNAERWPVVVYASSILMFGFRIVEQLTGDFMYWWGLFPLLQRYTKKKDLQWRYTFCKCWANVCTLLIETYKLWTMQRQVAALKAELLLDESVEDLTASPLLAKRTAATERVWNELGELMQQRLGSRIAAFRALCESIIYMKWASWYHPPKLFVTWLALISSSVGMWLVWHRTREKVKQDSLKRKQGVEVKYTILRSEW